MEAFNRPLVCHMTSKFLCPCVDGPFSLGRQEMQNRVQLYRQALIDMVNWFDKWDEDLGKINSVRLNKNSILGTLLQGDYIIFLNCNYVQKRGFYWCFSQYMYLLIFVAYLLKFLCRASERGRKKLLLPLIKRVSLKVDNFFFFRFQPETTIVLKILLSSFSPDFRSILASLKKILKPRVLKVSCKPCSYGGSRNPNSHDYIFLGFDDSQNVCKLLRDSQRLSSGLVVLGSGLLSSQSKIASSQ